MTIEQSIQTAISKVIEHEINEQIKFVNARVELAVREKIGEIAATVASKLSYERTGTDLLIRVHFDKGNK